MEEHNFLLVSIIPYKLSDTEALKDLQEVKSLIETYGGKLCDLVVQRREIHDKGMYIGRGKLEEVGNLVYQLKIDVVVLNAIVKPGQLYEMKQFLEKRNPQIQVWDKTDLILEIFAKHAMTAEAKLQIELASMHHMGPRIYGMGFVMSRQGGGIGTLGVGETNTELMKRHWRDQIKKVQEKLQKHAIERQRQLERRTKNGLQTVSLIGYTNAGKTSLFNYLTGKKNVVQNALFVTLDSSTGKVFLPTLKKEVIISDTIGFIRNLPISLIDAFRSTLLESIHADILLLVIDASDQDMEKKITVVEQVLGELRILDKKRIYVFNKLDQAIDLDREKLCVEYSNFTPQFISVQTGEGIPEVIKTVENMLENGSQASIRSRTRKKVYF